MSTIGRLIHREIAGTVSLVLAAFVGLFVFFDLLDEMPAVGRPSASAAHQIYGTHHALLQVALRMPSHIYELLPIAVLIGSIFVLARMAQSSEYTILRTSGLGPWRALRTLLELGLVFVALTFVIGDYVAPWADRLAQAQKASHQGSVDLGHSGAWLKDRQPYSHFFVNVGTIEAPGQLGRVRIFEFNNQGFLVSTLHAQSGHIEDDGSWTLHQGQRREFDTAGANAARIHSTAFAQFRWPNGISAEMISAALFQPDRMQTTDLFSYINHLKNNGQSALRYEIEFWRKVFYPMSCLVMLVLALPFAYLHFRNASMAGYVFSGVLIGISFFLLNNVFGHIGNLNQWQPSITAALPALIYTFFSLVAFAWLVLRR